MRAKFPRAGCAGERLGGGAGADQSQLDSMVNGEQSQIVSLRANLLKQNITLSRLSFARRAMVRYSGTDPPRYIRSCLAAASVMVFIPEQKRQIVAQFRQNSCYV